MGITEAISKNNLKQKNRSQILKCIAEKDATSRVEIASRLGLTRAAITVTTNEMIEENLLEIVGEVSPCGATAKGRRRLLLSINPRFRYVIGCAVSEYDISIGLTTLHYDEIEKTSIPLNNQTSEQEILDIISSNVLQLMQNNALKKEQILGVGIGIVPTQWQRLSARVEDGVFRYEKLAERLKASTGLETVALNAITLSAIWIHNRYYRDKNNLIYVSVGEQFNLSVVLGGEPMECLRHHTYTLDNCIVKKGETSFPGYPIGSVKSELCWSSIKKQLIRECSGISDSYLYWRSRGLRDLTNEIVLDAYRHNDAVTVKVMNEVIKKLAYLIYTMKIAYSGEIVFLRDFDESQPLYKKLQEEMRKLGGDALVDAVHGCPLRENKYFFVGCFLAVKELLIERGGKVAE